MANISGRLSAGEAGASLAGLWVEAVARAQNLPDPRALSAVLTDTAGAFHIELDDEELRRRFGRRRVELVFKVWREDLTELSVVNPDAAVWRLDEPHEVHLEIDTASVSQPELSEYETLVLKLAPQVEGRSLQDLNEREIDRMAARAAVEPAPLSVLVQATKLALEADLPTAVFYGLIRQELPSNLEKILDRESGELRSILMSAIETKLVPASIKEELPAALERLEMLKDQRKPLALVARSPRSGSTRSLLTFLESQNIRSLGDIRMSGGIAHLEGLPDSVDRPAVRDLEAHAQLSLLSPDREVREAIVRKGFADIGAIALSDRTQFVREMRGTMGDLKAARLHVQAGAQKTFIENVIADTAVAMAYGTEKKLSSRVKDMWGKRFAPSCSCKDCESAVSPLSYLADLIKYIKDHVHDAGGQVNYVFLERNFHQKFGTLPKACDSVEAEVRQVRICIEVLRSYLKGQQISATTQAELQSREREYLRSAYQRLLVQLGATYAELRLVQRAPDEAKRQLAERLAIPQDHLQDLLVDLDSTAVDSLEDKLEKLFGLANTRKDPLAQRPTPNVLAWRREHLRSLWEAQDWPDDTLPGGQPIIDPDVIGPDDFRTPVGADDAFALWLHRREWVDEQFRDLEAIPRASVTRTTGTTTTTFEILDLDAMLSAMYANWSYTYRSGSPTRRARWPANAPKESLLNLHEDLSNGREVDKAVQVAEEQLGLSIEAFNRLIAIWKKTAAWLADARSQEVTASEQREALSILVQSRKRLLFEAWRAEEEANGIDFGMNEFWISIREPVEGDWPPVTAGNVPLIDPELLQTNDLPDSAAGKRALELYDARQDELKKLRANLENIREGDATGGFLEMLEAALGDPLPLDLDETLNDLNNSDRSISASAEQDISSTLFLQADAFKRMMAIRAKESQTDSARKPTAAEYDEGYAILSTAQKRRALYPQWKNEEDNATTGVTYWSALKARLPRWRATTQVRTEWRQALRARTRSPIIDPDLIGPLHIKEPFSTKPAWLLWRGRSRFLATQLANLRQAREGAATARAGLEAILASTLGVSLNELLQLDELRAAGAGIVSRLAQLSLTSEAFACLVRLGRLISQSQPALAEEWADVYSILIAVRKQRNAALWREEERGTVVLTPDHFRIPPVDTSVFPPPPRPQLPPWRATFDVLLDWEDKLQARLDQEKAVEEALRQAVGATEESTLPALRDALILAFPNISGGLQQRAKILGDRLLIEMRDSGCARTTRTSQAIETLRNLIFSIRTGQLRDTHPNLDLRADAKATFDDDWLWMGSYGAWRAAMFVYIYPENIAIPNLRRQQTPAFRQLVKDLRTGGQVTPERARLAAQKYAEYFRDVCSLSLGATVAAERRRTNSKLLFLFAHSPSSGNAYWCTRDGVSTSAQSQSFWNRIPGLAGVISMVGAVEYAISAANHSIYLFARIDKDGQKKLVYTKYDIENGNWASEPTELELPNKATDLKEAKLYQTPTSTPPQVYIKLLDDSEHVRSLSQSGNDWSNADFKSTSETVYFAEFRDASLEDDLGVKSKFSNDFTPAEAARWMRAANDYARNTMGTTTDGKAIVAGFPTFHESGGVAGVIGLSESLAVPWIMSTNGLKSPSTSGFTASDFVAWSKAAMAIAVMIGYSAGLPTFADSGTNMVLIRQRDTRKNHIISLLLSWLVDALGQADHFTGLKPSHDSLFQSDSHAAAEQISYRFSGTNNISLPDHFAFPTFTEPDSYSDWVCQFHIRKTYARDLPPFVTTAALSDIVPLYGGPFEIAPRGDDVDPAKLAIRIRNAYQANKAAPAPLLTYFDEAWFFVPVHIALQLNRSGYYTEALDWFSTVYDYSAPLGARKVFYGLVAEESLETGYKRGEDWNWLRDPLDPHAIARARAGVYTRFTLLAEIRCLLSYADAEFTRDTAESVPLARTLYYTALELLDDSGLKQQLNGCSDLIGRLKTEYGEEFWIEETTPQLSKLWKDSIIPQLSNLTTAATLESVVAKISAIMSGTAPVEERMASVQQEIEAALQSEPPLPLHRALAQGEERLQAASLAVMAIPGVPEASLNFAASAGHVFDTAIVGLTGKPIAELEGESLPWLYGEGEMPWPSSSSPALIDGLTVLPPTPATLPLPGVQPGTVGRDPRLERIPYVDLASRTDLSPWIGDGFTLELDKGPVAKKPPTHIPALILDACIPPNPVLRALRLHADLNLHKIRTCRNIAGIQRELEDYAAPTDTSTGMPSIGAGGQLVLPGVGSRRPTPYRYAVLIDRAKNLVQLAQQVESNMLSALQQRDAEAYNILNARQDLQLARAGIKLQDLRLKEAEDGVGLAELQQERAELQLNHFASLLDADISGTERAALILMWVTVVLYGGAAIANIVAAATAGANVSGRASAIAAALSAGAGATSTTASILSTIASYERRRQEWQFQRELAAQDIAIGAQQTRIAQDHVRVVGQERAIAELQTQNEERTVDFLSTKFTNVELYDWMIEVLEGVYRYFLQQATAMAKLAESQLAFERQETTPPFILADYWQSASEETFGGSGNGTGPNRRGLTGSARLLQDIYQLDQYAFETNKRKLQLQKTLSLAQLMPGEFQRFRESGVLTFATPMQLFDRDFPGHYLRLIRRVKASVIALIPPQAGIKATLTASRISRVVIGGDIFQTVRVQHGPDMVALTSPLDATGLFELDAQSDMLAPFEGVGVDTVWDLRMPKAANPFDYDTIADVLITIDYTALNSFDYRQEVVQRLPRRLNAERPFSFRQEFADCWYDLHNPDRNAKPMVARFQTRKEDFARHLEPGSLRIEHLAVYVARANGKLFELPLNLLFNQEDSTSWVGGRAVSVEGVASTRRGNASSWLAITGDKEPFGNWELALPNIEEVRDRFKNEDIEDILFVITYSGRLPEWP